MSRFNTPDNASRSNIAQAHTLRGESTLKGLAQVNAIGPSANVKPATQFSTAPNKNPRRGRCRANDDTCKAFTSKGMDYCVGHARSLGLIENWGRGGRAGDESQRPD